MCVIANARSPLFSNTEIRTPKQQVPNLGLRATALIAQNVSCRRANQIAAANDAIVTEGVVRKSTFPGYTIVYTNLGQ